MTLTLQALILSMSIVLTPGLIRESLPIGSAEQTALTYLQRIADEVEFVTPEAESLRVPAYAWRDTEIGYYFALVENVRSRWWLPSFGGILRIRVGISADRTVTQVDITGSRVGLP